MGKTIVISDVHMSNGVDSYTWFKTPLEDKFYRFLSEILDDNSVSDIVIVGDLFDTWLYPIDVVPFTYSQIISKYNKIASVIKNLVEKKNSVVYLKGNHDMTITDTDLDFFSSGGRKLQLTSTKEFNLRHKNWHFEHGNDVDMFNAPDNSGDTLACLPLGYYVTRLIATAVDKHGDLSQYYAFVQDFKAGNFNENSSFFADMITLLELAADVTDCDKIRFSDDNDQKYTVGDIKKKYSTLLYRWWKRYPDNLLNTMLTALLNDGLQWYASLLTEEKKYSLIVMGHTHYPIENGIYLNDGCWCYSTTGSNYHTSYVEIDADNAVVKNYNG